MQAARFIPRVICLMLLIVASPLLAQASNGIRVVPTDWPCEYCFKDALLESYLTLNFGLLSGSPYRFGHYTGLEKDKHAFASIKIFSVETNGKYFKGTLENAGLDALNVQGKYGRWGEHSFSFKHGEIPLRQHQNLVTPYRLSASAGERQLNLPANWSSDLRTDTGNWNKFKLGSDWQRSQLAWLSQVSKQLSYRFDYQRIKQQGNRENSAAWLIAASYLPLPVDQHTDLLSGHLTYRSSAWHSTVSYRLSRFENNLNSVTVANPYPALSPGADSGQLALSPDNKAYQLALKINYDVNPTSWLKFNAATGEQRQDDKLLPYSNNLLLGTTPQEEVEGKVTTKDLSLKAGTHLTPRVSINLAYRYRQRDNQSKQLLLSPVVNDAFFGDIVRNFPRDRQSRTFSMGARWRFSPGQLASVSFSHKKDKRNFSRITDSTTDTLAARLALSHPKGWQALFGVRFSERDGEQKNLYPTYENAYQNQHTAGLMPYHQANKQQSDINGELRFPAWHRLSAALSGRYLSIRYDNNRFGLQKNHLTDLALDIHYPFNSRHNLNFYLRRETYRNTLAVSQGSSGLNWAARNRDHLMQLGLRYVSKHLLDGKLDVSFDGQYNNGNSYTRSASVGETPDLNQLGLEPLPKLDNDNIRLALTGSYHINPKTSVSLVYRFEKQLSDDYALDNLAPDALAELITFGAKSYNYHVDYFGFALSYRLF